MTYKGWTDCSPSALIPLLPKKKHEQKRERQRRKPGRGDEDNAFPIQVALPLTQQNNMKMKNYDNRRIGKVKQMSVKNSIIKKSIKQQEKEKQMPTTLLTSKTHHNNRFS